jgi:cytochrome c oxidase subunit 3
LPWKGNVIYYTIKSMSNYLRHPFHLVDESPWPLLASFRGMGLTTGLLKWFHYSNIYLFTRSLVFLILISFQWWRDVSRESSLMGLHTSIVELGLRWGIILFIVSEIFFFLRFFWAFFHRSLAVNIELGNKWPPIGVLPFNPFEVPLLNTVVLLSSGVRVTWAHHGIIARDHKQAKNRLIITVALGAYFTILQGAEYLEASFTFADSVYGSRFFLATGFHGLHVLVGTTFLMVCLYRLHLFNFRHRHHFGFEAAAWYWHFVDVVWLFLYMIIYWWGGA